MEGKLADGPRPYQISPPSLLGGVLCNNRAGRVERCCCAGDSQGAQNPPKARPALLLLRLLMLSAPSRYKPTGITSSTTTPIFALRNLSAHIRCMLTCGVLRRRQQPSHNAPPLAAQRAYPSRRSSQLFLPARHPLLAHICLLRYSPFTIRSQSELPRVEGSDVRDIRIAN